MTLYQEANNASDGATVDPETLRETTTNGGLGVASENITLGDLLVLIVPQSNSRRVRKVTREMGIRSATVLYASGTVHNFLADLLGLNEDRKALILMAVPAGTGSRLLLELAANLGLSKPNQGIAFRTELGAVLGMHQEKSDREQITGEERSRMSNQQKGASTADSYKAIITIVERGQAEDVMTAAIKGGARGGTILHGRGSGIHETAKVFNIEIEPEKDIVLILVNESIAGDVVESIRKDIRIDEPGQGVTFVQNIEEAVGLYKGK